MLLNVHEAFTGATMDLYVHTLSCMYRSMAAIAAEGFAATKLDLKN